MKNKCKIIILFCGLYFILGGIPNETKAQSQNSDLNSYWGNKGYIYSNPDIAEKTVKEKFPKIIPPKTKPSVYKKPKRFSPQQEKPPFSKELSYYEEPKEILSEERVLSLEKENALLKKKLKMVLQDLIQAKKEIRQLKAHLSPKTTQTYVVKKGDSLWKIAKNKEVYGDPYKWLLLYHANRDQIYDPNLIYPHMVLIVPRLEEYERKAK
ncbi:MAG: LysM peptidoglycan-binding domain-containing protein [Candidatus Omnitrophica bacterium]|nr:LysM peptidoglycan-binding domain-containing protein [Candidatus Omnitrophota bacterium]